MSCKEKCKYLIEFVNMSEKSSLFDWVKSRKVFIRSILRCLIELGDVRNLLKGFRGIRLS